MTVYRIQDSLGLPLWVRIRENEQAITHGDPRDVNLWAPGMWEVWQEFLWVFQLLEKYSILDRVSTSTNYQYLIQGRHLDYIQLRAKYPLSQFGITVVDTALEEPNEPRHT